AYNNLGLAYYTLGEARKALSYYEKHLKIVLELKDQVEEGRAYNNLGAAYDSLGEYRKALSYHNKHLKISQELKDQVEEKRAYNNLGIAYQKLGEPSKAITYHEEDLKIGLELQDQVVEERAYNNLGNVCQILGQYRKATEYYEKNLKIAQELKDRVGEAGAYCNLGVVYYRLGEARKAIPYHEKHLKIVQELKDQVQEWRAYCNLGTAYRELEEYPKAEEYFYKSIKINAFFQHNAKKAQWQVTLFEDLSKPYTGLEQVLLQSKNTKALEISDTRRSRALSSLLSQKLFLKENSDSSFNPLSTQKIQELAQTLSTTFVMYSLIQLNTREEAIQAWIISSKGKDPQSISLPITKETFAELDPIFKTFPYQQETKRPTRGSKSSTQLFNEKLSSWYDLLIAPLEEYLPLPDSEETLTFIPDGFLAHLPFGAFYNAKKDQYLIENYPISVAPSIQVLSLLNQLPEEFSNEALLIGNPTTPHQKDELKQAEREVSDIIAPMMKTSKTEVFIQKEATVANVFKHAPNARVIHIACHGIAEEKPQDDPYSVFEGFFKLASEDIKHPKYLHAKDVNSLALKADLVFMSACHLGRGNLQKEGSIGPIWSFLGAGAKSTIASYWPLPEGELTVKMVETFYQHYLGINTPKLSKVRALQKAILMAMKTERNKPRQWGSFFLSGLPV
ncbi:MAG: CHAT domain-containing protein, partial [Candidatus Rhabdochlamydia sp.]